MTILALLFSVFAVQAAPMPMPMPSGAMAKPMDAAPVCPKDAEPVPAILAPWASPMPLTAATSGAALARTVVTPGNAVDLALAETPAVTYVLRPAHPGGSVSHGGMVALTVSAAGTYRVAIGSGAWLDLVKDGVSLASLGHGHGPNCSGIRKMVDFALTPGSYVLEIAGNGTAQLPLLIAKLP